MQSHRLIRFGIIGAGRHASRYLRHLRWGDVAGADARLIWRRDAEAASRTAAEQGVRAAADWRELVDAADAMTDACYRSDVAGLSVRVHEGRRVDLQVDTKPHGMAPQ